MAISLFFVQSHHFFEKILAPHTFVKMNNISPTQTYNQRSKKKDNCSKTKKNNERRKLTMVVGEGLLSSPWQNIFDTNSAIFMFYTMFLKSFLILFFLLAEKFQKNTQIKIK